MATGVLAFGLAAVALCGPAAAATTAATTAAVKPGATTPPGIAAATLASAQRQADLVAEEDQRVIQAELAGRPNRVRKTARSIPYWTHTSGPWTLVLTSRRAPYTFDDLRTLMPESLVPQRDGSFLLREHVLVGPGATLQISPRKPLVIKMSSGPEGFVSLVTQGGRLRLDGTVAAPITFESWDESHGRQDRDVSDGRAYIRASGQLVVHHATFSRLGFWSGRTGGLSVVGAGTKVDADTVASAGGADDSDPGSSRTQVLPAGKLPAAEQDPDRSYATEISDTTVTGDAFGLFVTGVTGPTITSTVIRKSLVDGLVLHRDVDSATISGVTVQQSGEDGVVVSREVEGTVLTRLDVGQNGRDGIVLTGRPLADGPSASGQSTRPFGNNVLTASSSTGNARIGVHVIGGTAVRVQGDTVSGGRSGIVVSDGADDVDLDSNQVSGAAGNGIQVRESKKVTVTSNVVRDSATGIHVRNSIGVIRDNSTAGVTLHGISFVGRVAGSVVEENRLSGAGTSAIDTVRVTGHGDPKVGQNDLSGWSRTLTRDSLLSLLLHPLTVIWMMIAIALVAMSRPRRAVARLPYRADPLGRGTVGLSPGSPIGADGLADRQLDLRDDPGLVVIPDRAPPARAPQIARAPQSPALPLVPAGGPAAAAAPPNGTVPSLTLAALSTARRIPAPAQPQPRAETSFRPETAFQPEPSFRAETSSRPETSFGAEAPDRPEPAVGDEAPTWDEMLAPPEISPRPEVANQVEPPFRPEQIADSAVTAPQQIHSAPVPLQPSQPVQPSPPLQQAQPLRPAQRLYPAQADFEPFGSEPLGGEPLGAESAESEPVDSAHSDSGSPQSGSEADGFEPAGAGWGEPEWTQPEPEPAMAGYGVIDLAIRESRLNPTVPRRRRVVGR